MIVKENSGSGSRKAVPAGMQQAVCTQLVDLGTHTNTFKDDGSKQRKILLGFLFPEHTIEIDGEAIPIMSSKEYNLSLNEKATLRKHLEGWRSRKFTKEELAGFDLKNILGKPCTINVMHNDKGYAVIESVLPPMGEGAKVDTEPRYFSIDECKPEFPLAEQITENIPDWIKDKILSSDEGALWGTVDKPAKEDLAQTTENDSVPF